MIEMLHNEARKLLIEALEKKHKVQEVADCYSVNRSTVYRLKKRRKLQVQVACFIGQNDCYNGVGS